MLPEKITQLLIRYVPPQAAEYCFKVWQQAPFEFKIRKSRASKVGDFTCTPGKKPQITVNENLQAHLFLMTYIHEVAHHHVHIAYGHRVEAHGTEWKKSFQQLMLPLLTPEYFPEPLLSGLTKHMQNPKASSFSDSDLSRLFRELDPSQESGLLLSQVPEGSIFHLHGRWFTKGKLRRTRVLCRELKTRRQYLVPTDMVVENIQLSML